MAKEARAALNLADHILQRFEHHSRPRFWISRFSQAWFAASIQTSVWGDTSIEDEAEVRENSLLTGDRLELTFEPFRAVILGYFG